MKPGRIVTVRDRRARGFVARAMRRDCDRSAEELAGPLQTVGLERQLERADLEAAALDRQSQASCEGLARIDERTGCEDVQWTGLAGITVLRALEKSGTGADSAGDATMLAIDASNGAIPDARGRPFIMMTSRVGLALVARGPQ
jgi:hypothetical protein